MDKLPVPVALRVHQQSRVLEVVFDDDTTFTLSFEFLRVYSPSAEVQGHAPGQEVLQTGKRNVGISSIEPVGNYGMKPIFTDGHASGIFSWQYLYDIGRESDVLWARYLQKLQEEGYPGETGRDWPMAPRTQHHHHH